MADSERRDREKEGPRLRGGRDRARGIRREVDVETPRERPQPPRRARDLDEDDEDDLVGPRRMQAPRLRRGRHSPAERENLKGLVRDIPNFLKLLGRLARDPRVSAADKALVVAALGYVLVPADAVPDWFPVLGEIDDVFVLAMALSRLLNHAGIEVLLDHWDGDPQNLEVALSALDRAGSFLPDRIRGLLGLGRGR